MGDAGAGAPGAGSVATITPSRCTPGCESSRFLTPTREPIVSTAFFRRGSRPLVSMSAPFGGLARQSSERRYFSPEPPISSTTSTLFLRSRVVAGVTCWSSDMQLYVFCLGSPRSQSTLTVPRREKLVTVPRGKRFSSVMPSCASLKIHLGPRLTRVFSPITTSSASRGYTPLLALPSQTTLTPRAAAAAAAAATLAVAAEPPRFPPFLPLAASSVPSAL